MMSEREAEGGKGNHVSTGNIPSGKQMCSYNCGLELIVTIKFSVKTLMHSTPSKKRRLPAILTSTAQIEQQNFKDEIR